MTPEQLRLECVKLAMPHGVANPDMHMVIDRASVIHEFVTRDNGKPAPASITNVDDAKSPDKPITAPANSAHRVADRERIVKNTAR